MDKRDYYEVLGVDKDASESEIKKQFKTLAKEYHPDKHTDEEKAKENEEKFKELNEAYSILNDANKRSIYDQYGHDMGRSVQQAPDDLEDILRMAREGFMSGFGFQQPQGPMPITMGIPLTLKEMYEGVNKKMKYSVNKLCSHCNGNKYIPSDGGCVEACTSCNGTGMRMTTQGNMTFGQPCQDCNATGKKIINGCKHCNATGFEQVEQVIDIDIPKGISVNAQVRIPGKGNEMIFNGKGVVGDLILVIIGIQDSKFVREMNDLHCTLDVPIVDCLLGEEVSVETIDEKKRKFNLKVGTVNDDKFRLVGLGMPIQNTNMFGDLYVHINHIMPKELNEKEIELLKELKNSIDNGK